MFVFKLSAFIIAVSAFAYTIGMPMYGLYLGLP